MLTSQRVVESHPNPVEHPRVRYSRSCLPGEIQGRSGVLQKLVALAVARPLVVLVLLHAGSLRLLPVRPRVLHAEIHGLVLHRPEGPQERHALVVRDLDRSSPWTAIPLGGVGLAADLAALPRLLAPLGGRRGCSRAHALAGRARQAGDHLRRADLIDVRYDETLLEREEGRVEQLHVRERRMEQGRTPPHGEPRDLGPEQLVRAPREIAGPQDRVLAGPGRRDVGRAQLHRRHLRRPQRRAVLPLGQPVRVMMVVQMMVTVGRGGRRGDDAGDAAGAGATGVLRAVVVVVVVVVRGVQGAEGLLVRGLGILDQPRLRLVRLLLQQAVDLEPVGPPAVTRAGLGHAYQQAFPQTARLAGRAILLVDHADATVLAFGDAAEIVVGASEEGLCKQKAKEPRKGQR